MPLISVKNLTLSYENKNVVENMSFDIYKGDYIAVVGENGSGKTTLIKALSVLKDISSGSVESKVKKNERGYLPQQTVADSNFPATVNEVVLSGCIGEKKLFSFYNKKDRLRAKESMIKMGIEHIKNRPYRELSGGQKQRVLLARALCSEKKLILLDEPVSGLDPKASETMYELIGKINRESLISVIMVSHDIDSALKYANKILYIQEDGYFFGTTEEYKRGFLL